MKLTEWYEPTQKPKRKGVYQLQDLFDRKPFYAYWNGKYWLFGSSNGTPLQFQSRYWRGVAK